MKEMCLWFESDLSHEAYLDQHSHGGPSSESTLRIIFTAYLTFNHILPPMLMSYIFI